MIAARRLAQFFLDDEGACSCMRLTTFLVVGSVLLPWAFCVMRSGTYVDLGTNATLVALACIFGKVTQSGFEYGPWTRGHTPTDGPRAAAGQGGAGAPGVPRCGLSSTTPAPSPRTPGGAGHV